MMKAAVQSLAAAPALEKSRAADKTAWAVLGELFKMRLTFLVLLTTFVGFYAGWRGPMACGLMLHTLLGTALLAAGASALNQLLEREYDAKMRRTEDRPAAVRPHHAGGGADHRRGLRGGRDSSGWRWRSTR